MTDPRFTNRSSRMLRPCAPIVLVFFKAVSTTPSSFCKLSLNFFNVSSHIARSCRAFHHFPGRLDLELDQEHVEQLPGPRGVVAFERDGERVGPLQSLDG